MKSNNEWTLIRSNWIITLSHRVVVLSTSLQVIALAIVWTRLPPLVPLWYSRPWGADQLTSPIFLFLLPLFTAGIHLINTMLAMYVTTEYLIFTQSLFLSSIIVSLLSVIAVLKIIFLMV